MSDSLRQRIDVKLFVLRYRMECSNIRPVRWLGRAWYLSLRYLAGARRVRTADGLHTDGWLDEPGLAIAWDGACPVQGEGMVDGRHCYYRSRGEGWQFSVAPPGGSDEDVFADDAWEYSESPYIFPEGGWVHPEVTEAGIRKAVAKFRETTR
jgi:hypothetical protein